jgi:HSP20 family protein
MLSVKLNSKPMERSLDNFVDSFLTGLPDLFINDFNGMETKGSIPVNVKETAESYQLEVVAPGFEKTDFSINLDQQLLTIAAERKKEEEKESNKQIRREYSYRSFKRTFTVDEKIDATKIDATYINGVLVLNLPKKEEVKEAAKAITIK